MGPGASPTEGRPGRQPKIATEADMNDSSQDQIRALTERVEALEGALGVVAEATRASKVNESQFRKLLPQLEAIVRKYCKSP